MRLSSKTRDVLNDVVDMVAMAAFMLLSLASVARAAEEAIVEPTWVERMFALGSPQLLGGLAVGVAMLWGLYKTKLGSTVRAALKFPFVQRVYDRLIQYCELKAAHFEATHVPRLRAKLVAAGSDGRFTKAEVDELRVLFFAAVKDEFALFPLLQFLAGWSDDDAASHVAQIQDAVALKVSTASAVKESAKAGALAAAGP